MAPKKNNKKTKRESPARSVSPPAKKGRKTKEPNPVEEKINQLVSCIEDNQPDHPDSVKGLLLDTARNAFSKPVEERNHIVAPLISMIEETVVGFVNKAKEEEVIAFDKCKENEATKETLAQDLINLGTQIEQNNESIKAKTEELAGKKDIYEAKESAKKKLDGESREQLHPLNQAKQVLQQMQEQVDVIQELQPGHDLEDSVLKKKVAVLVTKLKEANAPSSLLISAPCSIRKKERSDFDLTVIKQMSDTFDRFIVEQVKKIESLQEGNKEMVGQVEQADREYETAFNEKQVAESELSELKEGKNRLSKELKEKEKEIKVHEKQIVHDDKEKESKTAEKDQLIEVHEIINFLRERTDIVQEEEVKEDITMETPQEITVQ